LSTRFSSRKKGDHVAWLAIEPNQQTASSVFSGITPTLYGRREPAHFSDSTRSEIVIFTQPRVEVLQVRRDSFNDRPCE
jgi:hypothetical protein